MNLPPIPLRMRARPVDARGYPVPWFVAQPEDGKPWDFRVVRPGGMSEAIMRDSCWLCGQPMGRYKVFVLGPMSAMQRLTSEPPCHLDCAEFAVRACPFILNPDMARSPRALPGDAIAIQVENANPGIYCLWKTFHYIPRRTRSYTASMDGIALEVGDPEGSVEWMRAGERATRLEVELSIERSLPRLLTAYSEPTVRFLVERIQAVLP